MRCFLFLFFFSFSISVYVVFVLSLGYMIFCLFFSSLFSAIPGFAPLSYFLLFFSACHRFAIYPTFLCSIVGFFF